jgi:hypothetical protein
MGEIMFTGSVAASLSAYKYGLVLNVRKMLKMCLGFSPRPDSRLP